MHGVSVRFTNGTTERHKYHTYEEAQRALDTFMRLPSVWLARYTGFA